MIREQRMLNFYLVERALTLCFKGKLLRWAQLYTPALKRLRQKNQEFKTNIGYTYKEILSQKEKKKFSTYYSQLRVGWPLRGGQGGHEASPCLDHPGLSLRDTAPHKHSLAKVTPNAVLPSASGILTGHPAAAASGIT